MNLQNQTKLNGTKRNETKLNQTKSTNKHLIELKFTKTQERNKLWPLVFAKAASAAAATSVVVCQACLNVFLCELPTYNTIKPLSK